MWVILLVMKIDSTDHDTILSRSRMNEIEIWVVWGGGERRKGRITTAK